ncbi:hypothetical protein V5O48_008748 [Marasmius crinis-equi]|uniref:Uncharacterized protein n=1 Tax=Marasmius crinis-equi TaxID=585013 RepID=A0ABR3FD63_9AGAR
MVIKKSLPVPFDPGVIPTILAGLAPTLLIVRVAYINPSDSVHQNQKVSTLAFAECSAMQDSRADRRNFHDAPALADNTVC